MSVADIILKNANVVTLDRAKPAASLIVVKGDKIWHVGAQSDESDFTGRTTRVIDGEAGTVLPAFNDAHVHLFSFLRKLVSLDLSPSQVSSVADIKAKIRHEAGLTPRGKWISGTDFSDFYLAEKRYPTRWDLDEVAKENPVVLSHAGLHVCVLNSYALRLAGINREAAAPKGCLIERDGRGEPTGVLHEMLGFIREKVMTPLTEAEIERGMQLLSSHFISQGVTSLQDATVVNDLRRFKIFRRLKESGKLLPRLSMMFGLEGLEAFREAGLAYLSGDSLLRLGGVKILVTESTGGVYPPPDELNEMVIRAAKAGFPTAIHAAQSRCVAEAVNVLEHLKKHLPGIKLRQRIEHLSICPPALLERLRDLKPTVAVQPAFIFGGDRYLAQTPEEEKPYIFRFSSLLKSGLTLAGSSDSPIAPDNPMFAIGEAMTRKTRGGNTLLSDESLKAEDGLRMYTQGAAYASSEEDVKGTVSPGKLADLVLLDKDPLGAPAEEVKDIKVRMTILGGKVVFEA